MPSTDATHIPPSEADTEGCDPVKTKRATPYKPWQDIVADKKAEQLSRIPKAWLLAEEVVRSSHGTTDLRPLAWTSGILSEREVEITNTPDATSLLAKIADRTYRSVEVVTAFCKRAAVAQQVSNCLTEIMFADAIAAAEKLDAEYERTGKTVGPLHGLPMTFKVQECVVFSGFDQSKLRRGSLLIGMLSRQRLRCLGWIHIASL